MHNLTSKNLSPRNDADRAKVAQDLIDVDGEELEDREFGQRVNDTYAMADYFLAAADEVPRFVKLLWGDPTIPPEPAEFAMYSAHAASARSLSASRRVGAALVVEDKVIATGYNDVPPGETADVIEGADASEIYKREMLKETIELVGHRLGVDTSALELTDIAKTLKRSMILSVIEGQRAVHAEAAAIDDAAMRGVAVRNATLYTTTFPCHLCFKAALDVEISEIRYIDPYPKSRAREMFPAGASRLHPYIGVAPRMFLRAFLVRQSRHAV
ncbi:deaminase [Allorhizocola rhizosphaerae]|uniref:deaminase n=1 Tax=Allorhizocola rhizosphaerae TaxID=1872709 RepID=UPI000E3DDE9F|nr:deaminase [Allorhizocola rhizosphaerae]